MLPAYFLLPPFNERGTREQAITSPEVACGKHAIEGGEAKFGLAHNTDVPCRLGLRVLDNLGTLFDGTCKARS